MENKKNNSGLPETVIFSSEDPKKIEELEKQLAEKEQQLKNTEKQVQEIKEKTNEAIKRMKQEIRNEADIKTDLTKKVIKQNTFKYNFRNGYGDGTVEKEKKRILADRKKAKAGTK